MRRELKFAPYRPKLTLVGLPGRQTGTVEREDERPQQLHQVDRLFPGRDQDRVWIGRLDDQSLGFEYAASSKTPLLGQTDACCLVLQAGWSC